MHLLILDGFAGTGSGHTLSFTDRLARGALELGWELTVVSPHPPDVAPVSWRRVGPTFVTGRKAWINHLAAWRAARVAGAVARRRDVDLVIDSYLHYEFGVHAIPADSIRRVRITHSLPRVRSASVRRPKHRWDRPHVKSLHRIVDNGEVLAALSEAGAETIRDLVGETGVIVMAMPIALDVERSHHPPNDPPVVAFLGEPRADKGWFELLAALEEVRTPMRLAVISVASIGQPAVDNPNVSIEVWRDVKSPTAFAAAIADADAVVLAHTEAFARRASTSNVALEALAAGQPVITGGAVAGQLPSDPVAYRVADPGNARGFAEALELLVGDLPAARRAAAETGPAFVSANHDPKAILVGLAHGLGLEV